MYKFKYLIYFTLVVLITACANPPDGVDEDMQKAIDLESSSWRPDFGGEPFLYVKDTNESSIYYDQYIGYGQWSIQELEDNGTIVDGSNALKYLFTGSGEVFLDMSIAEIGLQLDPIPTGMYDIKESGYVLTFNDLVDNNNSVEYEYISDSEMMKNV